VRLDEDLHGAVDAQARIFELRMQSATLMLGLVFERIMDPGSEHPTPRSEPESRPVFPRAAARDPEHELRDRAKAAKLRHRAAKARLKATHLEDRSKHLQTKADQMERRADELDGVSPSPVRSFVNE
jgi:hypothetical protein